MIFSLGDSFRALRGAEVQLREVSTGEPLSDLIRTIAGTTENIGGFFRLFRHRLVLLLLSILEIEVYPRIISVLGRLGNLDGPVLGKFEHHALFQYICFPPMALAEIVTGFYLMLFAVGRL